MTSHLSEATAHAAHAASLSSGAPHGDSRATPARPPARTLAQPPARTPAQPPVRTPSRPANIVMLHCGSHAQLATLADPALEPFRVRPVHARTCMSGDLDSADVVIVADRIRTDLLAPWSMALQARLAAGATVVVLGENRVGTWLPGAREEIRPTIFWWWRTGEDSRIHRTDSSHPAAEWFADRALTWHYHGVLEVPEGAESLVELHTPEGEVDGSLLYIDETSTPGRLLVTTMDPVYHHGSGFMPGATQLLYSVLRWASEGSR